MEKEQEGKSLIIPAVTAYRVIEQECKKYKKAAQKSRIHCLF